MTNSIEIEKTRGEFIDALALVTRDRRVADHYLKAITVFSGNFSDQTPRFRVCKTGESLTEGLVIFFGKGNEEVKIGLKRDVICVAIPSLGESVLELKGVLVYPERENGVTDRNSLLLLVNSGARIILGMQDVLMVQGRPTAIKFPRLSVEYLPTSSSSAAEAAAGTSASGKTRIA